jgi:hypothetical protein
VTNSTDGTASDTKQVDLKTIVFVAICLVGFVFYALFNKQVFPSASIDMKMDQSEAGRQSRLFAAKLGYDLKDNLSSTTFTIDDEAKTVLEFKLGIAEANRVMKDQVPVWLWHTRFCKPLSNDQLYVAWTTNGQFKSFNHLFANDKKFETITQDEALVKAEDFVKNVAKFDLTGYNLFDRGSESKPNRTDHHFIWRKAAYPECERRVRVEVAGNQVSFYRYFLSPTDTWTREYKKIRESNELLGKIASFFLFTFLIAAFVCFVLALTRHAIRWRFVLILSGVVAILSFLDQINSFSTSFVDNYNTSISFPTFVAQTAMSYLLLSLVGFLSSIFIVGGAEYVYRTCFPKQVAFPFLFTWKGMAQSDYRRKLAMGYLLPGLMMFWMITYYKLGEKVGYFCPLGVDDYRVIGNYFPALSGAMIGISAAGLEELSCRVVGLGLLQRLFKNFWVANFLQAAIWGFAHSQYPQEPCYARGVELTVIGLIFGAIVRSYGVLPCIVAHYLYDAFLTVEPVLGSHDPFLIIPSIVILLPFAIAALWAENWAVKNDFDAEHSDLTNFSVEHSPPPLHHQTEEEEESAATAHSAFSRATRIKLFAAIVLGFGVLAIPGGKELGEDSQLTTTAHQALIDAEKYLFQDGYAISDFNHVVQLVDAPGMNDKNSFQYLYEKAGFEKTQKIYDRVEPGLEWYVRFFKPDEPKGYWVYMNGDGSKRATLFSDIDEGSGAFLDRDAAFKVVETYLKKNRPELLPYTIDTEAKTIRPKRNDYAFDLIEPQLTAGDAKAKIKSEVKGDKLANLAIQWDLPDAWNWPHQQLKWYQQVANVLMLVELMAVIVALIWWGIHILRVTAIPWPSVAVVAVIGFVLNLGAVLNKMSSELANYNTAESFNSFVGQSVAMDLLRLMLAVAGLAIVWAVALPALKMSFPTISRQLKRNNLIAPVLSEQKTARLLLVFDATISSLALLGIMAALRHFQTLALSQFSPEVKIDFPSFVPTLMNSQSPFAESLLAVLLGLIWIIPILIIVASFWKRFLIGRYGVLLILLTAATSIGSSWYAETAVIAVFFNLLKGFIVLYFATSVFKLNSLSYIFFVLEAVALTYFNELISHAASVTVPEITLLALIALTPVLITIVLWLKSRATASQ